MKRKILGCEKVGLLVLMLAVLLLTSCGREAKRDVVQNAQDGVACLKRADLRLIAAALNRNTATMEDAIKSGADVNVTIEGLGPPIVITAVGDNYDGVKLLLDGGANVNAEDSEGYTALIAASFSNRPDVVRLLLSKGANVNAASNLMVDGKRSRFTPLMIAKAKGRQEIVRLLTEAGAME
jgi:ankyrin repeat protein